MTSRERLLCAFEHGTPDRVPVAPFGFGHVDPDSPVGHELVLKTDFIQSLGGPGGFLGTAAKAHTETNGNRRTTTIETPKGDLVSIWQSTGITSAQVQFPCKTADDVEKLLSVPYEPLRQIDPTQFNQWKERIGDEGIVLFGFADAICIPAQYFSPEDFSLLWVDAPEAFMTLINVANERLLQQAELCCKAGIDAFRLLGGEYASTQLGPSAYDETVTKPDSAICRMMHDHGAVVYYHNHGPTMRYLELLAGIGMDACDCFEAAPWGDCDLTEAMARIGERVCIVGNLDDMELIDKLPAQQVKAISRERIEQAGKTSFVLGGTASGTYTDKAARNFMAMAEVAREMS